MCLMIFKKAGKRVDPKLLYQAMQNNSDGAGFAVIEEENGKNELNTYRGIFEFKRFWAEFEPRQDLPAIIHFRNASYSTVSGDTCHPFRINEHLVFAHNGRIYNLPDSDKSSDTDVFNEKILKDLAKENPDFWMLESMQWFIENALGSNNKLVMMNSDGKFHIFNESSGHWKDDVWFSNYSYNKGWRNYSGNSVYSPCGMIGDTEWEEIMSELHEEEKEKKEGDVIDVEVEKVESAVESPTIESDKTTNNEMDLEEFETDDLKEIDRRIEAANRKQRATV